MFLLYLGEKRTEDHIITKDEKERGCFPLSERAEYGSVWGQIGKNPLAILEYRTRKRDVATNENGTCYIGYDNLKTGDKAQLQYVKFSEKEELIGQNATFEFKTSLPDSKSSSPIQTLNLLQVSLMSENFKEKLESNEKIEIIIAESEERKIKFFIFGFERIYRGIQEHIPEEDSNEVEGYIDWVLQCHLPEN